METSVLFCMLGLSHLDSTTRQCQMENKALHVTVIVSSKESTCQCSRCKRCGLDPWVGKITWRRKWQSTSVFLPGKSHGQRCLAGYSPWACKELDMTERLTRRRSIKTIKEKYWLLMKFYGYNSSLLIIKEMKDLFCVFG